MFWKEVNKLKKRASGSEERVKSDNGMILIEKDAISKK